ncbi:MAG TPA: ABC transporter substrate-binding protein, partial [Thermoanaerobaculia bacterium]|nr:ABC transporter substrate-binding protein [Thermoanaerobaculia bacterium]
MKSDSSGAVLAAAAACAVLAGSCVARAPRAPDAIAISVPWEIETLDPHASGTAGNLSLAANFYEPLVTSSPELRLAPALASAWENPDPLTWVFHLRPGARFHSGKAVGARDVVYSVERLRGDPELELAPYVRDVSDAEAVDERTVRLRTREPVTVLLNKLQYVFIVPEGSTEETLAESEDGSGPYRLVRWDPGSRIAMAAFDRPGTGRRQLGRVTFRLARGTDDAIEDLVSGRSQLVACNSRRLEDAAARLPGVAIERRDSLFVKYLAFDVSREAALFCPARTNPFRSAAVRHAVDLLIDRRRLAGTLAGTRAATQIVPPVVFGFDPELPPFPHDPDEARRLLRREGFPDGVRVALHTRRIFSETARLLKEMLADGGIDL